MKPKFICKQCKKVLTKDMEMEFSNHSCEVFCSPDCATTFYYEAMMSFPINMRELVERYPDGK